MPISSGGGDVQFGVRITADNELFVDGVRASTEEVKKLGEGLKQVAKDADGATQKQESLTAAVFKGNVAVDLAKKGVELLVGVYQRMKEEARENELQQVQLATVLSATGFAAQKSAAQIEALTQKLSSSTLFETNAIKGAAIQLATFGEITGDTFDRVMTAGANLATLFGGDLSSRTQQVAKALTEPVQSLGALERLVGRFSPELKGYVKLLESVGDAAGAQAVILDELERKTGNLADTVKTRMVAASDDLSKAWRELLGEMGKPGLLSDAGAAAMRQLADQLTRIKGLLEDGSWITKLQLLAGIASGGVFGITRGPQAAAGATPETDAARSEREKQERERFQRELSEQDFRALMVALDHQKKGQEKASQERKQLLEMDAANYIKSLEVQMEADDEFYRASAKAGDAAAQQRIKQEEEVARALQRMSQQEHKDALEGLRRRLEGIRDLAGEIGDVLSRSFGTAGRAIAGAVNALARFEERETRIAQEGADDLFKKFANFDFSGMADSFDEMVERNTRSSISMYADMASAAKGFFSEHSDGYKAMEAVEKAFRAVELALALKSFLAKIGFLQGELVVKTTTAAGAEAIDIAATIGAIARSFARAAASTAAGAAKAFEQMGVYGFVGAAAIIGYMASLGVRAGGGGGSGPSAEERQRVNGTGTVLGDTAAKSESITKALETLRDNSIEELVYQSQMLQSLRGIESAMSGVASLIARSMGITGANKANLNLGSSYNVNSPARTIAGWFGLGDKLPMSRLWSAIFGSTTRDLVDSGIRINEQTIRQAREGFSAEGYNTVRVTRSGWLNRITGRAGSHDENVPTDLDPSIARSFSLIVDSIVTSIHRAVDILGGDGDAIEEILNNLKIDPSQISFDGLKGDEIEEAVRNYFGAMGDTLAAEAMPEVAAFQQVGEGMFETLVRVASGVERARLALEQLGVTAIDWRDIADTQGDVATEMIRQSIVAAETIDGTVTGVGRIIEALDGTADDIIGIYRKLLDIRVLLRAVSIDAGDLSEALSEAMIRGAGGVTALARGLEAYQEHAFSAGERLAAAQREVARSFAELGLEVPANAAAFRALVESIDPATEAGQRLIGQLMKLAPLFFDTADAFAAAVHDMYNAAASLSHSFGKQYATAALNQAAQNWLDVSGGSWTVQQVLQEIGGLIEGGTAANPGGFQDALTFVESLGPEAVEAYRALLSAYSSWDQSLESGTPSMGDFTGSVDDGRRALEELARRIHDAKVALEEWLDQLRFSDQSPFAPATQLQMAQEDFEKTLAKAQLGDPEAIERLREVSQRYLDAAQAMFAFGPQYVDIFNRIREAIEALTADNNPGAPPTPPTPIDPETGLPVDQAAQLMALQKRFEDVLALAYRPDANQYTFEMLALAADQWVDLARELLGEGDLFDTIFKSVMDALGAFGLSLPEEDPAQSQSMMPGTMGEGPRVPRAETMASLSSPAMGSSSNDVRNLQDAVRDYLMALSSENVAAITDLRDTLVRKLDILSVNSRR